MFKQTRKVENGIWCISKIIRENDVNDVTEYTYDEKGRETSFKSKTGKYQSKTTYTETKDGCIIVVRDHNIYGKAINIYNKNDNTIYSSNKDGIVYNSYDENGNCIETIEISYKDLSKVVTSFSYDDNGNLLLTEDKSNSYHIKYTYDDEGRVIKMLDSRVGMEEHFVYNKYGYLERDYYVHHDQIKRNTIYDYDENGNNTKITFDAGWIDKEYDENGNLIREVNHTNDDALFIPIIEENESFCLDGIRLTRYKYDENNNLIECENLFKSGNKHNYKIEYIFIEI